MMFVLNRINVFLLIELDFFCPSTTGLVPCSATPTTFGDLRAANGQGQQRRRLTSIQPPTGLQEWLKMFQVKSSYSLTIQLSGILKSLL